MANKIEFPREMSFVDRQGIVVHPSREDYNSRKSTKVGKAYAFFNCEAIKGDIEKELPFIRKCVKTPNPLELSLIEGTDTLTGDPQLLQIAREAKDAGIRYVMEATYPNATNHQTADEVASVLNQAYQSQLYQKGEQFRGEVVYKDRGRYVFRE
ncbi:MAG: hypothetical protein AABX30_00950 [Nanoarchaeota archaeon]